MPKEKKNKVKTLRVLEILREYSDDLHPVNTEEIIRHLQDDYGIETERKSVYADIATLQACNYDIVVVSQPKKGYVLASREFEPVEVRILADAVQSAHFLNEKRAEELTAKILSFVSANDREKFRSQIYMDPNYRSQNKRLYITIDILSQAILEGKKVKVTYFVYDRIQDNEARKSNRAYSKLSVYALIWSNDHYYAICNNEKYDNFMPLRVERISSVSLLEDPARDCGEFSEYKEGFDVTDFSLVNFNGFSGRDVPVNVVLWADISLLQSVTDRLGPDVKILTFTEDSFDFEAEVSLSEGFYNWVGEFGPKMLIKSPPEARDEMLERAKKSVAQYRKLLDNET